MINRSLKQGISFPSATLLFLAFSCNNASTGSSPTPSDSVSTPVPAQTRPIADQGVNIAYTDTGKGDTTLLFVHGWAINKTYWDDQVKFFSSRYRVVTVDLPGFGQSGTNRKDWAYTEFARDLDSVLGQLDLHRVILIGHSMSGHIVLQAAINSPDRVIGIVGVDNFKNVGRKQTKEEKAQMLTVLETMKHHFTQLTTQYVSQSLFSPTTTDSVKRRVLHDMTYSDSVIAVAAMEPDDFDDVKQLLLLKRPLYLVNSDVNPTDTTAFKSNHIPYNILYVHGTGHYPMIEQPAEFNARLQDLITKM
jgi:pimeloyl-ACP methyl ester carboxylesterase